MGIRLSKMVGNTQLLRRISDDIDNNTLSHAYIIEGPEGSGRHTLAKSIAAALSCLDTASAPCETCKNCKKIFGDGSPDMIMQGLEGDKVTIGVESIRKIKEDMVIAPNELDVKVYVIENADVMTVQAQNAFLLSLEEPPKYVMFFLICESSNALLETIRSRAPILRLERLEDEEVEQYILRHDNRARQLKDEDPKAFNTVVFASNGCIGKAISLLDTAKRKALFDERETAERILSILSCPNRTEVLDIIASLGKKRNDVARYLVSVQHAVRDLILLKKSDTASLCFFPDREDALELSTRYTSASLMSLYNALCTACDELDANSNVRLTLLGMAQRAGLI